MEGLANEVDQYLEDNLKIVSLFKDRDGQRITGAVSESRHSISTVVDCEENEARRDDDDDRIVDGVQGCLCLVVRRHEGARAEILLGSDPLE